MPSTPPRTLEDSLYEPSMSAVSVLPATTGTGLLGGETARQVDVLAVPIAAGSDAGAARPGAEERSTPQPRPSAVQAAIDYDVDVAVTAELHGVSGKAGDVLTVPAPRGRAELPAKLLLIGVGDESAGSLRRAGAALARATFGAERVRATVVETLPPAAQRAFLEGFLLGGYRGPRIGVSTPPKPMAGMLELTGVDEAVVQASTVAAEATWLARTLTNMPSNVKNPQWMAEQSSRIAGTAGLTITVRDEKQLAAEGFGGLLAVGCGSPTPPRLVEVSYSPPETGAATEHVVLVGKGITYDSGGLSLKPSEAMVPMKTDMAGAAVVLAAVQAAAQLRVPHRVTGLLALAENAIGADSYRPGDVVTAYSGTTIEVGNTDAEGRMVLADALAYAAAELQPTVLIDIATLTGAASLGLGQRHAALYSTRDSLIEAIAAAAEETGERVWHMPLVDDYSFALESPIADLSHIAAPTAKVNGGSIVAALFLREFVGEVPWVHLDIAGPARAGADEHEVTKGATGYGARLLLSYLSAPSLGAAR